MEKYRPDPDWRLEKPDAVDPDNPEEEYQDALPPDTDHSLFSALVIVPVLAAVMVVIALLGFGIYTLVTN